MGAVPVALAKTKGEPRSPMRAGHVGRFWDRSKPDGTPPASSLPQRRPRLVAAGAVLVLVCALGGAELSSRSGHMGSYLGLARQVASGQRLTASALVLLSLRAGAGLTAIPVSEARHFLGRRLAVDLPAGSLLVPADFLAHDAPPPKSALVGASVQPGQAPASLTTGSPIWAITTAPAAATTGAVPGAANEQVLATGTVFSVVADSSAGGNLEVSIEVPRSDAPSVAAASAAGTLSLVEVAPGAAPPNPARHS